MHIYPLQKKKKLVHQNFNTTNNKQGKGFIPVVWRVFCLSKRCSMTFFNSSLELYFVFVPQVSTGHQPGLTRGSLSTYKDLWVLLISTSDNFFFFFFSFFFLKKRKSYKSNPGKKQEDPLGQAVQNSSNF